MLANSKRGCPGPAVWWKLALLCVLALGLGVGCSARRYAVNQLADALSHTGSTFASDDDPELVRAAVPSLVRGHQSH